MNEKNRFAQMPDKIMQFFILYIKSMRLYYSFVTAITGWIGVAYYEFQCGNHLNECAGNLPDFKSKLSIFVILFLSWGINQIINDFIGLKEDRINAPQRPMVTGELNIVKALSLSVISIFGSFIFTWIYLQPFAVTFLIAGVFLNILYGYFKRHSFGIAIYGLSITTTVLYSYYALSPVNSSFFLPETLSLLLIVVLMHMLMCFFTYFKDYKGDLSAGINTLVVTMGIRKSSRLGIIFSLFPISIYTLFHSSGVLTFKINETFLLLGLITVFLQIWTAVLFYLQPEGERAFTSLKHNTRACTCGQAAIISLFNAGLAIWLFLVTYIFVGFLFDLLGRSKE